MNPSVRVVALGFVEVVLVPVHRASRRDGLQFGQDGGRELRRGRQVFQLCQDGSSCCFEAPPDGLIIASRRAGQAALQDGADERDALCCFLPCR